MSLLANYYCLVINPKIDYVGKSVHLAFAVDKQLLPRVFKDNSKIGATDEIMFVDYIARRLEKCERESLRCILDLS